MTTPIRLGTANIARFRIMPSMVALLQVARAFASGSPWPDQRAVRSATLVRPSALSIDWRRKPRTPATHAGMASSANTLSLRECPIVEPPVEPVLVAGDVLLHRDV